MLVKRFGYAVALTTTSLIAILVSSLVFPSGKVDARPCGSDPLSRLGCTFDPTNPIDNDGSGRRYPKYFNVNIHNKTNRQVWVAVKYLGNPPRANSNIGSDSQVAQVMTGPSSQWKIRGYWKLAPGQKVLILNDEDRISNRVIYFHAHDDQTMVWGKDNVFEVGGNNQPFFEANMGNTIGEYTQSFTAN